MAVRFFSIGSMLLVACAAPATVSPSQTEDGHALSFVGSFSFSEKRLRKVIEQDLASFETDGDKPDVDDAAWTLERFFRGKGFPSVRVTYEYDRTESGRVRAVLRIEEGPRAYLDAVAFQGVDAFDHDTLRASFGERRSLLGEKRWYVESEVVSKIDDIERFYRVQGFMDVVVGRPDTLFSEDRRSVSLVVTVQEGLRYYLREVEFSGVSEAFRGVLDSVAAGALDQPYAPRTAHFLRSEIEAAYAERAHPDAELDFEVVRDDTSGAVVILMKVAEGPEVTIGAIDVRGNEQTGAKFIHSRVPLKEGELYDAMAVRTAFRELYNSGLFRKIEIGLEGSGSQRDLVVEVEELPTFEFWAEPGWGSYELARLSFGIRDRSSIFGTGRSLLLEATAAVRAQELVLSLTDPWFLESRYAMTYSLFGVRRKEPSFISNKEGVGLDLSRKWNPTWSSTFGYQYRFSNVESDDFSSIPQDLLQDADISSFVLTTTRDTRNEKFTPSTGSVTRLSLEWAEKAIGSELDFVRLQYTQSNFLSLTPTTVAGFSFRGGVIAPPEGEVVPLQERFFNGGERTVRSFGESELGLNDDGEPVGGEAFSVLTAELRQQVLDGFSTAVFVDTGNVAEFAKDAFAFEDMRYAIGFGVRYRLPVGPLRLDFAWNPDPRPTEDDFRLHFSVGMSF
ncbi:MAG: outer membrane protein assembly factor BamA [Planctomycetes bacterium]|jgi:outer membrane protein assembly complex protein YaeT|nr:outer membrane protein assembly factor BamA [Planctomycetota bacterium]